MVPIIIFTNVSDEKLLQGIDDNDITLFCRKDSFVPIELVAIIKKILDKKALKNSKKT